MYFIGALCDRQTPSRAKVKHECFAVRIFYSQRNLSLELDFPKRNGPYFHSLDVGKLVTTYKWLLYKAGKVHWMKTLCKAQFGNIMLLAKWSAWPVWAASITVFTKIFSFSFSLANQSFGYLHFHKACGLGGIWKQASQAAGLQHRVPL